MKKTAQQKEFHPFYKVIETTTRWTDDENGHSIVKKSCFQHRNPLTARERTFKFCDFRHRCFLNVKSGGVEGWGFLPKDYYTFEIQFICGPYFEDVIHVTDRYGNLLMDGTVWESDALAKWLNRKKTPWSKILECNMPASLN